MEKDNTMQFPFKRHPRLRGALAAALLLLPPALTAAGTVVVVVKETAIRADRKFFAPTQGVAHHLDRLDVLEEASGWFRVRQGSTTGWVHGSAVSTSAGSDSGSNVDSALHTLAGSDTKGHGYTQDEVALAGKGFNPDVEQNYRSRNPQAEFAAVDRMERQQVSRKELLRFAEAGKLERREGVAPAAADRADPASEEQGGMGGFLNDIKSGAGKIFGGSGTTPRQEKPVWEN